MRVQVAKIIHNGIYKIYDFDGVFSVVFQWSEFENCGYYGVRKRQKKLGDFPTLAAALYNIYSMVQCNYSPV